MSDFAKVRDHKNLVRDMRSKAILNTDRQTLVEHRRKKRLMTDIISQSTRIEKLEDDISQIKNMLVELIKKQ